MLFGGNPLGKRGRLGDTWEWDGLNWTPVADSEPLKRDDHDMTYDTARRRVVLFGGANGRFLSDTWVWDGKKWVELPVAGPSARGGIPSMAYDTDRKKVVLFVNGTTPGQFQTFGNGTACVGRRGNEIQSKVQGPTSAIVSTR